MKCAGRNGQHCCRRLKTCARPASVYFIKPIGHDGPIKIGRAVDAHKRLRGLDLISPFPLELLATIKGNDDLEGRFHRQFLHLHTSGEWFQADRQLTETIAAIADGTFDTNSLPANPAKHGDLYPRGAARKNERAPT